MNDKILNEVLLLLKSHYHIINIETVDDDRAEAIVKEIAESLGVPFFVWSLHRGLYNRSTKMSTQIPRMLKTL